MKRTLTPTVSLASLVQMLRDASTAPTASWPDYVNGIDPLAHASTAEAGACAALLSGCARGLIRQLQHIHPDGEPAMRMTLLTLSDLLLNELNQRGNPNAVPYYARADR